MTMATTTMMKQTTWWSRRASWRLRWDTERSRSSPALSLPSCRWWHRTRCRTQ